MTKHSRIGLALVAALSVGACDDGGGPASDASRSDTAPDVATTPDTSVSGEPCDFTMPISVTVDETITRELPSADCADRLHFYSFVPAVEGVYSIEKSGAGGLAFCETPAGGCICGGDINCCTECTLTFDLPDGSPLPAGSANEIYIDNAAAETGTYTFTIRGPM